MERGEPSLAPEWLRSAGGGSGSGSSSHPLASSSTPSDSSSSSSRGRSRNSKNVTSFDSPRSAYLDRSSSSNSRRNSSNGSAKNAYSSFIRSHRDKDWDRDRDKDRSNFGGDPWDLDSLASSLTIRGDKDTLRRSHSLVTRMQGEVLTRKVAVELKEGSGSNHAKGNGLIPGVTLPKVMLEKDFPSLGSEERQGVTDVVRVSSPVLSTVSQCSPAGSSSLLTGEGWTSALVEVPSVIGSNSSGSLSGMQVASAAASGTSSTMAGLNMAEALSQAPQRARAVPQLSVQTQRREELAIKQSRQLIPVTPSMPKSLVLNSSDKSKPKTLVRSGDVTIAAKNMQQQPSSTHSVNQPLLGSAKADAPKTSQSQGKLFVLKPGWENGMSPSPKDVASPTNNASRATNSQVAAPLVPSAPSRSPNKKLSSGERKPSALNLMSGFSLEKKPSPFQTQSRNDFFNLLKKKSSTNASAAPSEQTSVASSPTSGKSSERDKEVVSAPASPQAVQECAYLTDNGDNCEEVQRFSEEEEAAFLHSLGWEENTGDEEGLTEAEINAFYEEYKKKKPSLNLCAGVQQRLHESRANSVNGVSSDLSSFDSESEA